MICQQCKKKEKKSNVYIGSSYSTAMCVHSYYDENGEYHSHDPNIRSTSYSCSNNHSWVAKSSGSCWCGWGKVKVT